MAVTIAFLSMGATFWQAHVSRKHNRLSVRPHLDWAASTYYGKPIALRIANHGLGPAIIESMSIYWDGKECEISELVLPHPLYEFLAHMNQKSNSLLIGAGSPMKAGDSIELFGFEESSNSPSNHNQALDTVQQIGLTIVYRSMYGEKFSLSKPAQSV